MITDLINMLSRIGEINSVSLTVRKGKEPEEWVAVITATEGSTRTNPVLLKGTPEELEEKIASDDAFNWLTRNVAEIHKPAPAAAPAKTAAAAPAKAAPKKAADKKAAPTEAERQLASNLKLVEKGAGEVEALIKKKDRTAADKRRKEVFALAKQLGEDNIPEELMERLAGLKAEIAKLPEQTSIPM